MRTTSVLVAALVAASSAAAQQETRRFYYPRHIKRQFTNVTITSGTPSSSSADGSTTTLSTKRDDVLGNLPINLDPPTDTDVKVTTVVVQSTVFVAPTPNPFANGTIPDTTDRTKDEPITPTPPEGPSSSPAGTTNLVGVPLVGGTTSPAEPTTKPTDVPTEPTAGRPDPTIVDPGKAHSNSTSATFDSVVSVAPTTTSSSSSSTPIVIAPTGVVSESTSHHPEPTTPPSASGKNPLDPLSSLGSQIVSVITSLVPPLQNATETKAPETTPLPPLVTIPDITPSGTVPVTTPPPHTSEPPPSETVTSPPVSPTVVVPPPVTNSTEPPPPVSSASTTVPPPPPPTTTSHSVTVPPPPPVSSTITPNVTISANTTTPSLPTQTDATADVTSIPHLGPTTISQSWLPTTILVDPTSTTAAGGLAPTTATGIPTAYPKAITPETGQGPIPQDTVLIQVGLLEGYNYPFVVKNEMAAAQIFDLLKKALNDYGGFTGGQVQVRKLVPLDTSTSLGYITTLVYTTYPKNLVGALQMDLKIPASSLYNNPDVLTYNFTKQINPAIEILIGSYPDDASGTDGSGAPSSGTNTPNGSPFSNDDPNGKSSGQQGTTAGIVTGAVAVAAAYGAAMFVIARRYKRKRQSHRRASSISNPSEMQQTPRNSPALMGGALLSRDFTSYGGVLGGRDSHGTSSGRGGRDSHGTGSGRGGRDSHGSGRSGMGNSARTQYISAPVAAENSLGWN